MESRETKAAHSRGHDFPPPPLCDGARNVPTAACCESSGPFSMRQNRFPVSKTAHSNSHLPYSELHEILNFKISVKVS